MSKEFPKKPTLHEAYLREKSGQHMERISLPRLTFSMVQLLRYSGRIFPIFPFSGKSWITSVPKARARKKRQSRYSRKQKPVLRQKKKQQAASYYTQGNAVTQARAPICGALGQQGIHKANTTGARTVIPGFDHHLGLPQVPWNFWIVSTLLSRCPDFTQLRNNIKKNGCHETWKLVTYGSVKTHRTIMCLKEVFDFYGEQQFKDTHNSVV